MPDAHLDLEALKTYIRGTLNKPEERLVFELSFVGAECVASFRANTFQISASGSPSPGFGGGGWGERVRVRSSKSPLI
jgi:hypothetical protein